jgi:hypothetical protein
MSMTSSIEAPGNVGSRSMKPAAVPACAVRIYKTEKRIGKQINTYTVRWKVGGQTHKRPFRNATQAETFRGDVQSAAKRGEAFNLATGEPVAWLRAQRDMSWSDFAISDVDMKWKDSSGGYRRDIARALMAATPAMYLTARGKASEAEIRKALTMWAFNSRRRAECPDSAVGILNWMSRCTRPMSALHDPILTRAMLDAATTRLDGTRNATSTISRNRTSSTTPSNTPSNCRFSRGIRSRTLDGKRPRSHMS